MPPFFVRRMLNRRRGSSQRKGSLARDCPPISSARFALHSLHPLPCLVTPPVAAHIKMGRRNGPLKPWQPVSKGHLPRVASDSISSDTHLPITRAVVARFRRSVAGREPSQHRHDSCPLHLKAVQPTARRTARFSQARGFHRAASLHSIRSRPPATDCHSPDCAGGNRCASDRFRERLVGTGRPTSSYPTDPRMRPKSHSFRADRLFPLPFPMVEHSR